MLVRFKYFLAGVVPLDVAVKYTNNQRQAVDWIDCRHFGTAVPDIDKILLRQSLGLVTLHEALTQEAMNHA